MYAENNICADAREKMSKYSVVLVLYSNERLGQKNIFFLRSRSTRLFYPIDLLYPCLQNQINFQHKICAPLQKYGSLTFK